jgi:hypothetical protein
MRRRRLALLVALAVLAAALPASAAAEFGPTTTADGPDANIVSLGGIGTARTDPTGAVAYLKRETAQAHVFASPLVRGTPTAPVRVDAGQVGDASDLHMAVGNRGRTVVAWVNGGTPYAAVKGADSASFGPPVRLCTCGPVNELSVDMSIFGTAYATFTTAGAGGHDIRGAVLSGGSWTPLAGVIDVDPNRDARSARVAASADGTAVVAFTETAAGGGSHVYERRLLHSTLSTVPQEAGVGTLDSRPGGSADSPAVDVQDDSTFAWVVFRQDFNDGGAVRSRVLARRLTGSRFGAPVAIDGLAFPTAQGAEKPVVDITGRGYGGALANLVGSYAIDGAVLTRRQDPLTTTFEPPFQLDASNDSPPMTAVSFSEDADGVAAWQDAGGGSSNVLARHYDGTQFHLPVGLSPGAQGPSAAELGLDVTSDGAGDSVIAFVQGPAGARRIQVAAFGGTVSVGRVAGSRGWKRNRRPTMRWAKTQTVPWGPIRYRVEIDGVAQVTSERNHFRPAKPIGDGVHAIRIVAIDGRGSETDGRDVGLRIDLRKPTGRVRRAGKGMWSVSASDGPPIKGSGIASARLVFGGASVRVPVARLGIVENARVRHGGGHPRLVLVDRAGNKRVIR